jgi:conjugal transfer pilus assembly protein TraV
MSEIAPFPAIGLAVMLTTALALGGCASTLSGVGGAENYACKAPVGAQCTSVSGVYANATHSASDATKTPKQSAEPIVISRYFGANLVTPPLAGSQAPSAAGPASEPGKTPAVSLHESSASPPNKTPATAITPSAAPAAAAAPTLRTNPRVLRLWIAPWEDSDGDLHDASFVNVVVDTGRWLIERVRPASRSRIDVATPPLTQSAPVAAPTGEATSPNSRVATPSNSGPAPDSSSPER